MRTELATDVFFFGSSEDRQEIPFADSLANGAYEARWQRHA